MSELIIDKERGLTALDMLSTTYKKTVQIAKKSSKAALSLILVFFAFLGFNAMPTDSVPQAVTTQENSSGNDTSKRIEASSPAVKVITTPRVTPVAIAKAQAAVEENARAASLKFPGLDKNGIPSGFTVTDSTGAIGSLYMTNRPPVLSETELTISQIVKTDNGAANIFISQQLASDSSGFKYSALVSYGKAGAWTPLNSKLIFVDSERLISGDYLVTAIINVDSEIETSIVIPATALGRDLSVPPRQVITRLVLNPSKTQVLAQAIYVVEKGTK